MRRTRDPTTEPGSRCRHVPRPITIPRASAPHSTNIVKKHHVNRHGYMFPTLWFSRLYLSQYAMQSFVGVQTLGWRQLGNLPCSRWRLAKATKQTRMTICTLTEKGQAGMDEIGRTGVFNPTKANKHDSVLSPTGIIIRPSVGEQCWLTAGLPFPYPNPPTARPWTWPALS